MPTNLNFFIQENRDNKIYKYTGYFLDQPEISFEGSSIEELSLKVQEYLKNLPEYKDCQISVDYKYYYQGISK